MRCLILIACFIGSLAALGVIAAALLAEPTAALTWLSLSLALLLPLLNLPAALSLFLLLLPLFGNRPGSKAAQHLLLLSSALQIGLALSLLRQKNRRCLAYFPKENSIIFFCYIFLLVAILSLSGLPLSEYYYSLRSAIPAWRDFSALVYRFYALTTSSEETIDYSFLSVIWTAFSVNICLLLYLSARENARCLLHYGAMILGGLVLALAAGLADYYQIIDLRFWRPLDPIVNPNDVQFRLQSFFGHSGWFAEYVTLAIPYSMLVLLLPLKFACRLTLLLALLLLGEFALILTFQRGGWISYPLTLFAVWSAVYIAYRMERGERDFVKAFQESLLKIGFSLPLTLALSFSLLYTLNHYQLLPYGSEFKIERYWQRLKEIQRTADRSDFVRAAYRLGLLNPFLGGGSESFAFHFEREFNTPSGRFFGQLNLPLHGSAHNVYAQTFAGKGLAGLTILMLLVIGTAYSCLRHTFHNPALPFSNKVFLLIGASFAAAFLIYGNVQEVFYIQSLQYLFFASLALVAAAGGGWKISDKERLSMFYFLAVMLALSMLWKMNDGAITLPPTTYGCYAPEADQNGRTFRWCGVRARQLFRVAETPLQETDTNGEKSKIVSLNIKTGLNRYGNQPVTIQVRLKGQKIFEAPITALHEHHFEIHIPKELERHCEAGEIMLDLATASYFIPLRDTPPARDMRALSYMLY